MFGILSITFIVLLLAAILYGFGIVMRRPPTTEETQTEQCAICHKRLPKSSLVERQIGDYKLLYFCGECIESLSRDSAQLPLRRV